MSNLPLIGLIVILLVVALVLIFVRRKPAVKKNKPQKAKAGRKSDKKASPEEPDQKATPAQAKQAKAKSGAAPPPPAAKIDTSTSILGGPTPKPAAMPTPPKPLPGGHIADGDKIRILIVDDNTGTRENVSRLLYFEGDLEVIGQAVNGRQGVEMATDLKPHIVLMDINMPDMDGITATKEMSIVAPFSQVIIMSVQADQHYMKQAMAAGARDFQPKPFTSEELVTCIRRVYSIGQPVYRQFATMEQAKEEQKAAKKVAAAEEKTLEGGPIIVVYSPKGGTGTSAIAVNLAVALHQQHGDTVLMDGALQFGDILVHLNTRPTRTIMDLVHDGKLEEDLVLDILLPHDSGIKLLLAPQQPEMAEAISSGMVIEIAKTLRNQFKAVVIDTTSKLTEVTLALLDLADYILMVTTPDLPAIKSAKLFLELSGKFEYTTNKTHIVINKFDLPGGIKPRQIQEVLQLQQTFRIPHDARMYLGLNQGRAVCQQEPSSPSAQAISGMSQNIWQQILEASTTAEDAE